MDYAVGGFDRDDGNREKCGKHGVRLEEVEAVFLGEMLVSPDAGHSVAETRFIGIGRDRSARPMFVVFTLRERDGLRLIRPISARYMHAKEVRAYEASRPPPGDR